jgi:transcriptional regulator GlxA family with amidase domain
MRIVIFLFDGVTALDAVGPYESLARLRNVSVQFVGKQTGLIRTGDGFLALNADHDIRSVRSADILIVPGAQKRGLAAVIPDPEVQDWIRSVDAHSRWTAAVCTGSLILGAAGLLNGRRASTHWRAAAGLARFGAEYSSDRVTIDGKYITSAGVSAGIDMGLRLCADLAGQDVAEAIQLSIQYAPDPPFDTGDPAVSATPARIELIDTALRQ